MGSPLQNITLPMSPLPEGTFPAPEKEISPTKCGGERQVLANSSSDEPNMILCAGTSKTLAGMSVRETPTEHASVHHSPQTSKLSEREQSDTLTERQSEKPK